MKVSLNGDVLTYIPDEKGNILFSGDYYPYVKEIVLASGITAICKGFFWGFNNLEKLYIPKTCTRLEKAILPEKNGEIAITYEGSSEDFLKMGKMQEVYVSGPYDRYPYYSDYGASMEIEQFCLRNEKLLPCRVYCEEDGVTLVYDKSEPRIELPEGQ